MRKHKLKNYLKFGILLLGISILFVSCEEDYDDVFGLENNSAITVKTLNQKQVESNKEIASKLQRINTNLKTESTLILAKGIYNKDYDFTINTDYVKYIEKGDYHSYNFSITRQNSNDKRVENLLLSLNNQGGYDAFIIKYDFSKEEYKNIDKTKLKKGTTEYIPIDFDTSNFSDGVFAKSTLRFICEEKWIWAMTDKGDEGQLVGAENVESPTYGWVLESSSCSWVDTGGKDYDYVDNGSTNDETNDNCDTCGANGSTNINGTETTIISVPIMFSLEYTQFYNNLNFEQTKWCDDNYYLIDGYLSKNGYSVEAKEFANEAFKVLMNNGEADFDNEILKDASFIGTKADCVLNALISKGNNIFKKTSQAFTGGRSKFKLKFTTYNDPDDQADARTGMPESGSTIIAVKFNLFVMQSNYSIDLAGTILHETIHAELQRIKLSNNAGPNPLPADQYNWYLDLLTFYEGFYEDQNIIATEAEHDFMSNYFINPIASGLREFDDNTHPLKNYKFYAWGGLQDYGKRNGFITQTELSNLAELSKTVRDDPHTNPCD